MVVDVRVEARALQEEDLAGMAINEIRFYCEESFWFERLWR